MSGEKVGFQAIIEISPEIVKDAEKDEEYIGYFEGIASTPQIDLEGDAFTVDVLKENVERIKGKPILFGHGRDPKLRDTPVGKILDAWMDGGVLKIKAGIYKKFKDIWEKIKNGVLRGLSIGGIAKKIKRETVNVIEDAEINEVSLAPKPVNPSAQIYNVFGKSFKVEDGILTIVDVKLEKGGESEAGEERFEKVDLDLPIVKRASWDGDAAAKRIFKWAEREDGTIDKAKAGKLFLIVRGDGKQRGDYAWPVGDIVDGNPVLVSSGIITAIKYASGARGVQAPPEVKRALERLAKRLVKEGILPEDYEVPWKREKSEETEIKVKEFEDLKAELMKAIDEKIKEMASNISKQILESLKVEKSEEVKEEKEAEKKEVETKLEEKKEEQPASEPKPPEKGMASGEEAIRKTPEPKVITPSQVPSLYRLYAEIYGEDKISD